MESVETLLGPASITGALWTLGHPEDPEPSESTFTVGDYSEAVFEPDNRLPVDVTDYQDGGKYRSVVKILMRYEGQAPDDKRWAIGTGYLVSPDTFITAGHCVFDRSSDGKNGFGRVKSMKCYIGYRGRASINEPDSDVQARTAVRTITTSEWIKDGERRRDVAFVRIDEPFEGRFGVKSLRPFIFQDTPVQEDGALLGVVGYPGDKSLDNENGAEMFELFETVDYDLTKSDMDMLEYRISTFKGQSGAPVIRRGFTVPTNGRNIVIGTHCYGGEGKNSASPIGGEYGVDYPFYIRALDEENEAITDITDKPMTIAPVPTGTVVIPENPNDTEDFLGILKDIGRVVAPVAQAALPLVSPLLGPLGGPVSAIGGIALGALNKAVAESGFDGTSPVGIHSQIELEEGSAERAVAAEAALQTFLRMERSPTSERILATMRNKYAETGFTRAQASKLGPKLVPLLAQAGLRMAINENLLQSNVAFAGAMPVPISKSEVGFDSEDPSAESFLQAVGQSEVNVLRPVPAAQASGVAVCVCGFKDDPESFFQDLGAFLGKGLRLTKPLLLTGAREGLKKLDDLLAAKQDPLTESLLSGPDGNSLTDDATVTDEKAASLIVLRAIVAEVALQAVVEADMADLKESVVLGDSSGAEPEGFFGKMLKTVQKIGPAVAKVAPVVLKSAVPILVNTTGGAFGVPRPISAAAAAAAAVTRAAVVEGDIAEVEDA
ncbi:trypsin-like cysteine/serine peptidase domain-containing protein, partial [Lasiosphaeris hirsuta]